MISIRKCLSMIMLRESARVQSRSNEIGRNTLSFHLNKSTRYRGKIVVQVSHPHAQIRAIADAIEEGPRGTEYYHTKSRICIFKHVIKEGEGKENRIYNIMHTIEYV